MCSDVNWMGCCEICFDRAVRVIDYNGAGSELRGSGGGGCAGNSGKCCNFAGRSGSNSSPRNGSAHNQNVVIQPERAVCGKI